MKQKTFLVSSSIQELVPRQKTKIIFLGKWCFTSINMNRIKNCDYKTLKYHWKNKKKLEKDYYIIKKLYKIIAKDLCSYLNAVHKKNFSENYWNQIFGNWLMEFIIFIYDKYSIVNSLEKDADYCSYLIGKSEKVIPNTSLEALSLFQDEMYNHQIFSEIMMKFRPNIKFIKKKKKIINIKKKSLNQKYSFLLKTLSYRLKKENGNNEIFILSSYLGLLREILLQIKLNGFLRFNFCEEIKRKFQIDFIKRNIKLKESKSFLRMLKLMVIQNLPASYLEGYDYVKTLGYKKKWPNNPKKIFTSVSHLYSDVFKVWLAEKREKRSKFIVGQHGIGYLVSKFHSQYDLDLARSDKLIFWGNKKFKDKKIIKGFNFLSRSKINRTKNFYITMVQKFPHKYLTKLISNDYNISTIDQNIKSQKIFLSSLSKKFQNQIKIRYCFSNNFFPDVYNYEKKYWSDIKDRFKFESRSTPMNKSLKTTKLVILNSIHSTLFFECLSNGIPCIIFSNFFSDSFYKEGKKDFKSLQKVGIIHNDPIKLSKFINKNFENLNSWWNGREVNRVKKKFIEKYCRFESNPIKAMSKILSTC